MTNWADYGGVVVNNSNEELLLAFDSPVPGPWSWGHGKLPAGKRTRPSLDVDGVRPVRVGIMIEWVDARTGAMLGRAWAGSWWKIRNGCTATIRNSPSPSRLYMTLSYDNAFGLLTTFTSPLVKTDADFGWSSSVRYFSVT